DESMAALTYFLYTDSKLRQLKREIDYFMVIDFGGGTTDITVGKRRDDVFEPIIASGDPEFGGKDVNKWICDICGLEDSPDIELQAETLKLKLDGKDKNPWKEYAAKIPMKNRLDYEDFSNELLRRLKERFSFILKDIILNDLKPVLTADSYHKNLNEDGGGSEESEKPKLNTETKPKNLYVFLAGGSSSLSLFKELIVEIIKDLLMDTDLENVLDVKDKIRNAPEPKKCVSRGAYLYESTSVIDVRKGDASRMISAIRVLWPVFGNLDVVRKKFPRIITYPISATESCNYAVILDRNTTIPSQTVTFVPQEVFQIRDETCPIELYVQRGCTAPYLHPLDDGITSSVPKKINSSAPLEVRIDENNKIRVTSKNKPI
ncbi:MAG: hypothetical protein PHU23_15890, partial [Dehalococcoidales bacterium]|nr:hypothetical protein [Dehalococcoidales bacterium]